MNSNEGSRRESAPVSGSSLKAGIDPKHGRLKWILGSLPGHA